MKALVYYARWQNASVRLRGRDATAVYGHLVTLTEDEQEELQPFHFLLKEHQLTLTHADGSEETLQLDEMGTVVG